MLQYLFNVNTKINSTHIYPCHIVMIQCHVYHWLPTDCDITVAQIQIQIQIQND